MEQSKIIQLLKDNPYTNHVDNCTDITDLFYAKKFIEDICSEEDFQILFVREIYNNVLNKIGQLSNITHWNRRQDL